jgi:ribosomal protein S18 acetylase RimI-like enzyme
MLTIVPYESKYAHSFKELNLAWITEYFIVEKKDTELLGNCESSIIDQGGFIFISLWNETPVGCFALVKINEGIYELGKMAVVKSHQGLQIGQKMLVFAIEYAQNQNLEKILLYSSKKLDTALHIYKKYGFKEIPLEEDVIYARSDIKMELTL